MLDEHVLIAEAGKNMQDPLVPRFWPQISEYFVSKSHKYHLHQNHIAGSFSLVKFMGREDSQEKLPDLRQTQNINHKVKRKIWLHIPADLFKDQCFNFSLMLQMSDHK